MTETYWCPGPWPWEWFRTCTREVPDPPDQTDPCNAAVCIDAKDRLAKARSRFESNCNGLRLVKQVQEAVRQLLAPIWVWIVIGVIVTILAGDGVLIVIAIWMGLYLLNWALGVAGLELAKAMNNARSDFNSALIDVISQCPDHCRGDVSAPECILD